MSFSKSYCFALLFAVMLAPACARQSVPPEAASAAASAAVACDGVVFSIAAGNSGVRSGVSRMR